MLNSLRETEGGVLYFQSGTGIGLSVRAVTVLETEQGAYKECLWGWEELYIAVLSWMHYGL